MDELSFDFNFSNLDLIRLHASDRITTDEIIFIFKNSEKLWEEGRPSLSDTIFLQIGYSPKKRFLLIAFSFIDSSIDFIGVKVADEADVSLYFCSH